ncbi:oligomeric, coiled-coil, peripheral membrane protein [Actinomortierella ambigua]|nr:oligomeric, coiled-coil, peripheral membrane protein [Actinomortierella ambigua]
MRLYRAETGKRVLIPQLRPNDGLDTLKIAIEKATRIPPSSQILMTSSGLQLKPDMMFEAITSSGKDEYTIMVYNREVLTTDISNSILSLTEQVKVEPPIRPLSPSQTQLALAPSSSQTTIDYREWGLHFQRVFEGYVSHLLSYYRAIVAHAGVCERIMEELRVQAMAVQVALTNLDAHSRSVIDTFEKFNAFAAKEFAKQARLLQSFPRDIETLRRIRVHPALLQQDSPDRYIADFIPADKLVIWADRCREIHDGLVREGKELTLAIKEVQEGTLAIRNNSGINLDQLEDAMSEILHTVEQQSQLKHRLERDQSKVKERITDLASPAKLSSAAMNLEELSQLAHIYQTDYILMSRQADEELRNKVGIFISAKHSQTANLITQLMHISKLQSTIASIPPSLGNLDDALRKRDADFSQLVYVQRIPIAYGALVVEIVRRREYTKLLLQKSQQLAEVMSRFRHLEQRRRDSFRSEVAKFVPVVVSGLDDPPPFCEINTLNTKDRLPVLTRENLVEFERVVQQLRASMVGSSPKGGESSIHGGGGALHALVAAELSAGGAATSSSSVSVSSTESSQQDALTKLRVTLTKMTNQMEVMSGEFDRLLEKSFYTERLQRLEEENVKLRADTSRTDVQQRAGTPQLAQQPFSRIQATINTAGSTTTTSGTTAVNAPTSPKLSRQHSKGGATAAPAAPAAAAQAPVSGGGNLSSAGRFDVDEAAMAAMNQNQVRLMRENAELLSKNKAYEARIRSLEETLFQNFRAKSMGGGGASGTSPTGASSLTFSGRGSSRPASVSLSPEQGINIVEDDRLQRQLEAKEQEVETKERELEAKEQELEMKERELDDAAHTIEQLEKELRDAKLSQQESSTTNDHLRQEVLELKLQCASQPDAMEEWALNMDAAQKRANELEQELKDMTTKHDHLLAHQEKEKELQGLEVKALKDRIDELTSRLGLEKEILEGQLEQAKRVADEATERATELENELEVVNEELQNKVLQLEEEVEHHATEHIEVKARFKEQEQQLESHRAVHSDILAQLREQETRTAEAKAELEKAQTEASALQTQVSQLEAERAKVEDQLLQLKEAQDQVTHKLEVSEAAKHDLNLEVDGLRAQLTDIHGQHDSYKGNVNLRLEEAKLMVRRAEEDWKEKAKLLEQMEKAIKDLDEPLKECMHTLDLDVPGVCVANVEQAHERIEEIRQAITQLLQVHATQRKESDAKMHEHVDKLTKEHSSTKQALESTVLTLEQALETAKEDSRSIKQELEAAVAKAHEELESLRQERTTSPVPEPSPPPVTIVSPTFAPQGLSRQQSWSLTDRRIMCTLSLDLGIPVPMLMDIGSSQILLPSASMLLEKSSESRQRSSSATASSSVTATTGSSGSGSSRQGSSSSTMTVPLPRDQLATIDFAQVDMEKLAALIKRKNADADHMFKRWQRECRSLKDKYGRAAAEAFEKIAFRNFKVDDLALFLPTRNSISKPWAAFNINSPHYFLQMTPSMAAQIKNREWIVARIHSITEAVVDRRLEQSPPPAVATEGSSDGDQQQQQPFSPNNPYGLADGVKYYLLEATSWNGPSSYHGHGKSSSSSSSSNHHGASGSSSSRLRHHASTPVLSESQSGSRREKERAKKEGEDPSPGKHEKRLSSVFEASSSSAASPSPSSSSAMAKDSPRAQHIKSASETSVRSTSAPTGSAASTLLSSAEVVQSGASGSQSPAVLSLLQQQQHQQQQQQQASSGSTGRIASIFNRRLSGAEASSAPSGSGSSGSLAQQQQLHQQHSTTTRHQRHGSISQAEGGGEGMSSPLTMSSSSSSLLLAKSQPIPIQQQQQHQSSPAANALRATLSSSVGSTGSGGSQSSSLHAPHPVVHPAAAAVAAAAVVSSTHVTSSPPRTMILSSSPLKTTVSTVSAMGRTVGVGAGAGGGGGSSSSAGSGGGSSNVGGGGLGISSTANTTGLGTSPSGVVGQQTLSTSSNSSLSSSSLSSAGGSGSGSGSGSGGTHSHPHPATKAPVNPSRLSMSSNRDDLEQMGLFATDEDQEAEREKQETQAREQAQQQRATLTSRSSSSSTSSMWHVPNQ